MNNLICILGHTAAGKTSIAAKLALEINGEIISADSRQVYKGMDIGTGKDLEDYTIGNITIPYHIIDICEPGYKYNIFEYSKDFKIAYEKVVRNNTFPILCGGSGLYIETLINNYAMIEVPVNQELRDSLEGKDLEELEKILSQYKKLHNKSDTDTTKRAIRAIEIAKYQHEHGNIEQTKSNLNTLIFGIAYDRDTRRERITARLKQRMENGLIEEAQNLLKQGLSLEDMEYYGLEYKYLSLFLAGKISKTEMFEQLNIAIHQFAKRQMTWFRRMEKRGTNIYWLNPENNLQEHVEYMTKKKEDVFG
ncbi:MAG: tRNA (adenosine(37)-N6)-dimethylallyltransferase MiaA [Bacteroidales bacterium]|nr:tRNA (adenosine(37)-N6)-dimethylallyltransferase MiaA [Bacteroidales bacterium]